jgi:hypothetical protein
MSGHGNWRFTAVSLIFVLLILSVYSQASKDNNRDRAGSASKTDVVEVGSCSLGLAQAVTDEAAIVALLNAEGTYVTEQDIVALMRLWIQEGRVVDAKHSPLDVTDDQTWQGADAIRHRYIHRVFPGAPALAQPADLVIRITGEKAVVTSTTRIGNEVSPKGDRWQLVKEEGCWVIQELVFNLEPP